MYNQIAANRQKTIFLITIFLAVLIGAGYAASVYWDSPDILFLAVIVSVGMSWWSYFAGDKAILSMSGAKLVRHGAELKETQIVHLVENLCITAGLPMPKVYLINDPAPNAFAVGRDPKHASIALTTGIVEKLDKAELEGVIAHELSHVKNYDILLSTVVITLLGVITLIADWMSRRRIIGFGGNSNRNNRNNIMAVVALVFLILAPIFAQLVYLAISRQREYLADASGALLTRYPEGLANALKKLTADTNQLKFANRATAGLYIVNPFKKTNAVLAETWSTHPPLIKRIAALEHMNI
ncbi:M48 family metallopeptidase [Patescibacteria group bacterium]|nr:M48 family metallopeptidase [Patescibacteria group bacterium]